MDAARMTVDGPVAWSVQWKIVDRGINCPAEEMAFSGCTSHTLWPELVESIVCFEAAVF